MLVQHRTASKLQLVRRSYRMLEDLRKDPDGPADRVARDLMDERFELRLPDTYPEGAQGFYGHDGLQKWTAWTREVWGEWRFEVERLIEAGQRVVALVHVVAKGGLSGVRLERDTAHVWTLANGKVLRCEVYLDRSDGLAAVGLSAHD
jgi:ketosteroid isomerase-like protein